jgi:single-strand DNA-binding protein
MSNFAETATLTADPELRFTRSGRAVAQMRFAINSGYRTPSGEWVDNQTTFLDGQLWNGAENVAESLRQGHRVLVIGDLRTRSWETEAGEKRSTTYVEVSEVGPSTRFATVQVTKIRRERPATA